MFMWAQRLTRTQINRLGAGMQPSQMIGRTERKRGPISSRPHPFCFLKKQLSLSVRFSLRTKVALPNA